MNETWKEKIERILRENAPEPVDIKVKELPDYTLLERGFQPV